MKATPKVLGDRQTQRELSTTDKKKTESGTYIAGANRSFWDATNSHHVLPVFASGTAVVPSSFDTILCQSFYNTLIPAICEALVCGQDMKSVHQVRIPHTFVGETYQDVFRAFISRNILVLGLYRSASEEDQSYLPYVYGSPSPTSKCRAEDRLFVLCDNFTLEKALVSLQLPIVQGSTEGTRFLGNLPSL